MRIKTEDMGKLLRHQTPLKKTLIFLAIVLVFLSTQYFSIFWKLTDNFNVFARLIKE